MPKPANFKKAQKTVAFRDEGEPSEKTKKARTANPGVRVQGGRIYDSESGTTCHQCRQKTIELKAKCTRCTMHWCPRCLFNRYGEALEEVSKLKDWPCPRCRDICNCSNCRKKRGFQATGILANICKAAGIGPVSELLKKNPSAKRNDLQPAGEPKVKAAKAPKAKAKTTDGSHETAKADLVPDNQLAKRVTAFPEGEPVQIFRGQGKRARGIPAWPKGLNSPSLLSGDCSAGDLIEVVEFLKVFGSKFGCDIPDMPFFAAELVQAEAAGNAICTEQESLVGRAHQKLLDLVRQDWGLKGTVGITGWQTVMQQYLKAERERAAQKFGMSLPQQTHDNAGAAEDVPLGINGSGGQTILPTPNDPLAEYPNGGYWSLPPGWRVRMLRELCHDALGTSALRECMEKVFDKSAAAAKEERQTAAAARKEAKQAWQQEQQRHIALMLAGETGKGMTIEQQRLMMEAAKRKAHTELGQDKLDAPVTVRDELLRAEPLGRERDGRIVWHLQTSALFTGSQQSVLVAKAWQAIDDDEWSCHRELHKLVAALDPKGQLEGCLREEICSRLDLAPESGGARVQGKACGQKKGKRNQENKQPTSKPKATKGRKRKP